jgi:hypothetical protein
MNIIFRIPLCQLDIYMKLIKYTVEQLKEAVKKSVSIRQALTHLNLNPEGGNYRCFHKAVKFYNIDTSHFTGQSLKGRKLRPRRKSIEEYLQIGTTVISYKLKKYLVEAGIFKWECSRCKQTEWEEQKIPLELEHKNGIHNDNRLENLCLLCPNCHALTPTYRAKNKWSRRRDSNSQSLTSTQF